MFEMIKRNPFTSLLVVGAVAITAYYFREELGSVAQAAGSKVGELAGKTAEAATSVS